MNNLPDVSKLPAFLLVAAIIWIVVTARYFLLSWFFYSFFYVWKKEKWEVLKINKRNYPDGQFKTEMWRSALSGILFGLAGALMLLLWQKGYIKVYEKISDYPVWHLPLSLLLALFAQETYYYWLHRWMHRPNIYRIVHQWHHESKIASPWTAFSFHPIEAFIQAIFLPLLLLVLPMHLYVFVFYLLIMSVSSVVNHLDIEVYPKWFVNNFLGKWIIGATHHSLHHKQFKHNYGLYFTFWDKLAGTESPVYEKMMDSKTNNSSQPI